MYVHRTESDVMGSYHTVFGISNYNMLPQLMRRRPLHKK